MDILIDWQEFKTELNDEEVTMELMRISTEGHLLISQFIGIFTSEDGKEVKMTMDKHEALLKMQTAVKPVIKAHVQNIKGITINSKEVEPEMLCGYPLFTNLVAEIVGELFVRARITEGQEKNLERPSGCGEQDTEQTS